MHKYLAIILLSSLSVAACNGEIYLRDGVTDGDTFYLARRALTDDDPVLQSWVSYSLTKSTCQLQIGGENPARASSFDCEVSARRALAETWLEQRAEGPDIEDAYLDDLIEVHSAGYLGEYVVHHFVRKNWQLPPDLDSRSYQRWQRRNIARHNAETRIIGSWNYARNVYPLRIRD